MRLRSARRSPGVAPAGPTLELSLIAVFLLCWLVFFALALLGHPLAGALPLGLYVHYAAAAALGWVIGNVFVQRSGHWLPPTRRRLLLGLLLSPGGLFYLAWSLESQSLRGAAPLGPLYAYAVFVVFFLVPVSFRGAYLRGR